MKIYSIILSVLLLLPFSLCAKNVSIGAGSGVSFYQQDLSGYWEHAPLWGLDFSYPFREKLPVVISIYGSVHQPLEEQNGITHTVLFINADIAFEYGFLRQRRINPLIGLGFTSTTMVAYKEWPPQNNDDESELGITGNGGIRWQVSDKISLDMLYKQYMLFTEPRYLTFGSLGLRFMIDIERGTKNEK